jgi:nitroreductase
MTRIPLPSSRWPAPPTIALTHPHRQGRGSASTTSSPPVTGRTGNRITQGGRIPHRTRSNFFWRAASDYLREALAEVPVLVIGAISATEAELAGNQAGLWGSLLPAAWSLALALRARGLGTTWTTLHLRYEREVADLLGLPADVRQGVLLPVAYTKGTDFRRGPRVDLDSVLHVNGW